ncbi:D-glycerate dehydrogenase [Candidatus Bathyarchaeota archaeon]|nr:D-glycerate dehydrogenase [Candidatus Bathyarchaeota archaeon]
MIKTPKHKVYVTRELPDRGLSLILENFDAEVWREYIPPTKDQLKEHISDVEAIASNVADKVDGDLFDAAPKLRIVSQMAVGFDNIDVAEATRRGIYVTNTPEVLTETTADYAFALLLAVARRVVEADNYVRQGKWTVGWHPSFMQGRDVNGATIGIVGAGRIGYAVAKRAKGFNMKILYYDVAPRPEMERELNAKRVDLKTVFSEPDFVSVHVPLMIETRHLVNEEKLSLMKKTAYLINTSRGPVVDEKALFDALVHHKIAGAAIDVFEQEPTPSDNPLLKLENLVVAPHIASSSYETRQKMSELVAINLISYFKGEIPPNLVNKELINKNIKII